MPPKAIKRGPGRPRKERPTETVSDLPVEVINCLHGRSAELIKITVEIKEKRDALNKQLEEAEKELQTILEFISEHEQQVSEEEDDE